MAENQQVTENEQERDELTDRSAKTAIEETLDRRDEALQQGTPTVPMLQGVFKQAIARAVAEPERRVVVVLATDGFPDGCFAPSGPKQLTNTLDNVVLLAKEAFEGAPSIPLFVVGVGDNLEQLDRVAAAGGNYPQLGKRLQCSAVDHVDLGNEYLPAL